LRLHLFGEHIEERLMPTRTPKLGRGTRLTGEQRNDVVHELARRYNAGKSIREICAETDYSIGRVRRLLEDGGVQFRPRGGPRRRPYDRG
jgi:transposase